jgi:polysaccharide biosynthesis transport protein
LIIGIFLITVLVAGIVSFFVLNSVYKATATIAFNKPKNKSPLIEYFSVKEYKDMLLDLEIEAEIIKKLNLDKTPYNMSVFSLEQNISTKTDDNLIEINYRFSEPELAKNITNQWIEKFVQKQNFIYINNIIDSYNSILEEYEKAEKEFLDIEKEKVQFDINGNVGILDSQLYRNQLKINTYNSRISEINLSIAKLEATKKLIKLELEKEGSTIKLQKSINDEQYFQRLFDKIADGNFEMPAIWYEIEEKNPVYYSLVGKLLSTELDIKAMETEKEKILADLNKISPDIDRLKQELVDAKLIENNLNREYLKAFESYYELSNKYQEIDLIYQSRSDILEIKEPAYQPEAPIRPNKKQNIAIAGLLGLFMGIFIAFFVEFWQNKMNTISSNTCFYIGKII